ncbi:MAG: DUF935 family protein [Halomonas sp.]
MARKADTRVYAATDRMRALRGFTEPLFRNDDPVLQRRGAGDLEIYRELLRDDQVAAMYGQRFLGTTSAEWSVEPASERRKDKAAADWLKEQLQSLEWDTITHQMLYARHYGFATAEMIWARDGSKVAISDIRVRDQRRFKLRTDGGLQLMDDTITGIPMPERKFWTIVVGGENADQPYGRGLAHQLYWPVFFKRSGVKYWMVYLERFAQPTPKATMPGAQIDDPESRKKALAMLEAVQVDSGVLVPEHINLELLEASRSGTVDYDTLKGGMDQAIAKLIVGQSLTSDPSGGQYKADVQEDVLHRLQKADADLVSQSFHRGPLAWLMEWNFPGARAPSIWRDMEPEEDLNQRAERDKRISELGYRPTQEYIVDTYGPGWEPAQSPTADAGMPPVPGGGPEFAEAPESQKGDQEGIAEAARRSARNYPEVLGERVAELLDYLETTDDVAGFRRHLAELVESKPPEEAVEKLHRHGLAARLLGQLRKQRK